MNEKERQQIKDYVIGTMKLSYPDMRKNEIDLFLEDLDAIIEGRDIPHTKEDIDRRLKLLKDMEKYYPKGRIQVVCDPLIRDELHFDHDWFNDESEVSGDYGMRIIVHLIGIDIFFPEEEPCRITVPTVHRAELMNQLISLIQDCGDTDSGLDYIDFRPAMDKCEFRYEKIVLENKDKYVDMADSIIKSAPSEVTIFVNGAISLADIQAFHQPFEDYKGDIRLCWRYTEEYGENAAIVSIFFKEEE